MQVIPKSHDTLTSNLLVLLNLDILVRAFIRKWQGLCMPQYEIGNDMEEIGDTSALPLHARTVQCTVQVAHALFCLPAISFGDSIS